MKVDQTTGTSRMLIWGSALTIVGFLIWANWAELDQITRASGQVININFSFHIVLAFPPSRGFATPLQ